MATMRNNSKPSVFETYIEDDNRNRQKQVSEVLKKYDLDGDGKLDAAEQQNIGHDMLRMEDIARLQKKLLMFAFGVIVFLCVSNIATGYLAVMLAKDTKVAKDGVMKDTSGGNIKTQAIASKVNLYDSLESGRRLKSKHRRLQNEDFPSHDDFLYDSYLNGSIDEESVASILRGDTVTFVFENGFRRCDIMSAWAPDEMGPFNIETSCGPGSMYLELGGASLMITASPVPPDVSTPVPAPTDDFLVPEEECNDSFEMFLDPFENLGGMITDCAQVAALPEIPGKMIYCSNEAVGKACPRTCGYCPEECLEDKDELRYTGSTCSEESLNTPSFCDWAAGNHYACPVTCDACLTPEDFTPPEDDLTGGGW